MRSPPCTLLVHNLCTLWNTLFSILFIFRILSIYNIKCINTPKFYYSARDAPTFVLVGLQKCHVCITWLVEDMKRLLPVCLSIWPPHYVPSTSYHFPLIIIFQLTTKQYNGPSDAAVQCKLIQVNHSDWTCTAKLKPVWFPKSGIADCFSSKWLVDCCCKFIH